jgi:hypothetical protein
MRVGLGMDLEVQNLQEYITYFFLFSLGLILTDLII